MRAVLAILLVAAGPAFADDDDEAPGSRETSVPQKSDNTQLRPSLTLHRPADEKSKPTAPENERSVDGDKPLKLNPEGTYQGVAIGNDNPPPHPPHMPVKGPQVLTWSGFQIKGGVPTVFLQLTGTPDYSISDSGNSVTVILRNTKIAIRNNRRPLRVEAFDSTVKNIAATKHGKDVRVVIQTKSGVSHKEHTEPGANGYQLLLIEVK
jgi:hypothetical protein